MGRFWHEDTAMGAFCIGVQISVIESMPQNIEAQKMRDQFPMTVAFGV